ncbi:MAG: 6-phosphogluconolactonase [Anaerolineae bacterium]|nr:6-phosphogluconolactonase [Anaerolineae bacterium]
MAAGELRVYPDAQALAYEAAAQIAALLSEAIAARKSATLALSGGSTPHLTYTLLAAHFSERVDWQRVQIFWGDERCVPPDHPESNYRMAYETLLTQVSIPEANIHRMQGELPPDEAALAYEQELRAVFGEAAIPRFDLILLGLGDNGHVASLFPGTAAIEEHTRWVVAHYIESLESWRLTFTPPLLNAAATALFLVSGSRKGRRLKQVREGPYRPQRLPAQIVAPTDGKLLWLVDAQAAQA